MRKRKILLRFDDICPTMNWEQWEKAKKLLDTAGVTALLGVIPDNHDPNLKIDDPIPNFWDCIKNFQQQGYVIAMHGYQHIFDINANGIVTRKGEQNHSEFAGHPYRVQFIKIKKGKEILQSNGIYTDVFFAPAHSYDDNTLKALAANGFKYISDGKSHKPYMRNGIICIPAHSGGVPKMKSGGYYTAVFHAHEWVMKNKNQDFEKLRKICLNAATDIISFKEFCKQEHGNPFIQKISERIYCFVDIAVKPIVQKILKYVKFQK